MKHTTAEYLAWIDNKLAILTEIENTTLVMPMEVIARASLLANRDVLVRHAKSETQDYYKNYGCDACGFDSEYIQYNQVFPCPTYLDIASKLDEVM